MRKVNAYAALEKGGKLKPFQFDLPELSSDQVEIKVHYCGLCHSDWSMLKNDWRTTQYPFVPGHEIVGEIVSAGHAVKGMKVGDYVGLGWISESCMHCNSCMEGSHNLCATKEETIVGRHGGFADYVRCHWSSAIVLPKTVDMSKAGPLFCGGITVFNPILMANVKPTDKVGVVGIGGLGHLAIKFLNKWGCDVTAFSSTASKKDEILAMGAHRVVNSTDPAEMKKVRGQLDFILNTTNVSLHWNSYLGALAPKGTFHTVGAGVEPMSIPGFHLIGGEKSISGSPVGSPAQMRKMVEFCIRHNIYPTTEEFNLADVNEAFDHLANGKARYRVVLKVAGI